MELPGTEHECDLLFQQYVCYSSSSLSTAHLRQVIAIDKDLLVYAVGSFCGARVSGIHFKHREVCDFSVFMCVHFPITTPPKSTLTMLFWSSSDVLSSSVA
jgi:hypothetical protein